MAADAQARVVDLIPGVDRPARRESNRQDRTFGGRRSVRNRRID
jgi:hypothetical protein